MPASPLLSVVVPVFDEQDNLADLVAEVRKALDSANILFELILVDDGSRDDSWQVIAQEATQDPRVRGLRLKKNCGQSSATVAGFGAARGAWVATLDGDLQNDPADLPRLLQRGQEEGADVVLGWREKRHDSFLRRLSSQIANSYRRGMTGDNTKDTGCSLKVFRAEALQNIPYFNGMHRYLPTLVQLHGNLRVLQEPVHHRPRTRGVSKYGVWNRLWVGLADVRGVRWLQARRLGHEVAEETHHA